jgi:hypothetical protein
MFEAQHVTRSEVLLFGVPPAQLFPLFTPLKEKQWSEGWDPQMIFSTSATAEEEGCVFTSRHVGEPETLWVLAHYDPVRFRLAYAAFTPSLRVSHISIECVPAADSHSEVRVSYAITGLSDSGNEYVARYTPEHFRQFMHHWQHAIAHYLASLPHTGG